MRHNGPGPGVRSLGSLEGGCGGYSSRGAPAVLLLTLKLQEYDGGTTGRSAGLEARVEVRVVSGAQREERGPAWKRAEDTG